MLRLLTIVFSIGLMTGSDPAMAQVPNAAARPARPAPPTRDPNTPGYVTAKELPDGANAPAKTDGNFILGPTHNPAPEMTAQEGVPQGAVFTFTMEAADSKIYPVLAREAALPIYVTAKELPDGANAPAKTDGNFILGPTHNPAPEMTAQEGVPQGAVFTFTMESADSKIYPGIAREANTFGQADPTDPGKLVVTTSHPAPYTRRVAVYVPKQYVPGTAAPFIVGADGPDRALFTALDNLIAQHRVPVMIAI